MSTRQFTSHGLNFIVESTGFVNAGDDFADICDRIEQELDGMPTTEVTRLHGAAIVTSDGPEAVALYDIGNFHKAKVTRGWFNANGCDVSLIAIPD